MKAKIIICLFSCLTVLPHAAQARVKLVALPERARVVVSLAHPDATLVEEERVLTLQKGVNKVDFSWRGVNIDATSIQVRMLGHPDKVLVLNTSYPPNENALVWEVASPAAQEERVRISYLLSGLNRDIVYRAVAEPNEQGLTFRNYLRLRNDSGEDLTDAEISIGYGADFKKTIANEEILEMLSERVDGLPIKKVLTWDAASLPWDPEYEKKTVGIPLSYVIMNDKASKLGTHPLLPGKARIFLKTRELDDAGKPKPEGGVAFTGEDWVQLTPADRELKLFAATFLATATAALQESRPTAGLLGESSVPTTTARNAVLAGTGAVLREQAQAIRDSIARDGFYLRVPAGKPFYLYLTQTLDRSQARRSPALAHLTTPSLP